MKLEAFEKALEYVLEEVPDDLVTHAIDQYEKEGRGALCLRFTHQAKESKVRLEISYISEVKLPPHKYLPRTIEEYDPESELVILAVLDDHQIVGHFSFDELLDGDDDLGAD